MADSSEKQKIAILEPELQKFAAVIKQSTKIEEGSPNRYHVDPTTNFCDQSKLCRNITFGKRDTQKKHKTILMVGETGTGKTKQINTMINYMLGVQKDDKVWFEITDDQSKLSEIHSQTSIITVYEFYLQESQIDLTIIDTPGYGDTRGAEKDKEIAMNLLSLSECDNSFCKLDLVCLVIKATQTRLSDRQMYIFDAIQSLFGKNIAENIVLILTYSRGDFPNKVLTAVKEAKIKCAVNEQKQPVFFLFDNCQGETFSVDNQMIQELSWNLSLKGIQGFFQFLHNMESKHLRLTQGVLKKRQELESKFSSIKSHVEKINQKQNQLKKTQYALEQHKKAAEDNKNFDYEVDVPYKEKVDIDTAKARVALCCTVCEENCHYPGCRRVTPLSWCEVLKGGHCTVCTNKCHYSKHVKENKIYETKTKKEKKTNEDLKKKYDENIKKIISVESEIKKLENEMQTLETQKVKLVMDAFHCVDTLKLIALNPESLFILKHIDFLIEKVKEINETEKAEILENIKKEAGEEKNTAITYMKCF